MDVFANVPPSWFLQFQKKYNLEVGRLLRARDIVTRGEIRLLPNGNFAVRSHTKNAPPEYQVNPRFESCQCYDANMQWSQGVLVKEAQICKHIASYLLLRELDFDLARQEVIATGEPRVAMLQIEIRETAAREQRDAHGRSEWIEEI